MFDIRKPLALAAAVVMSLSFSACGSKDDDDDDEKKVKEYSSAVDLIKDVNDHIGDMGYAIEMDMAINVNMKKGDQTLDIKIVQHVEGTSDREYKHSITQQDTAYEGYSEKNTSERSEKYQHKSGSKLETYTTEDEGKTWTYSMEDDNDNLLGSAPENFKNAKIKTTSKGYEIRGKFSDFGASNPFTKEGDGINGLGLTDMDYVMTISADLEPVSIVVEKTDFESPKEYAEKAVGEGGTITGDVEITAKYSDWGKVKPGDINIPEEALKAAA